jgi:hypothetical protein
MPLMANWVKEKISRRVRPSHFKSRRLPNWKSRGISPSYPINSLVDFAFSIAAGAHTVYFLCRPNDALSDLPIYPDATEVQEVCVVCKTEKGESDSPLECEKVRLFSLYYRLF